LVEHRKPLRVGDRVVVPWGVDQVKGRVVEVWGDPATHVRVELDMGEGEEPEILLLNPNVVRRAS
jgi:primosomal protein N'